jgi:hypothetical protein
MLVAIPEPRAAEGTQLPIWTVYPALTPDSRDPSLITRSGDVGGRDQSPR